jgi:DNA-binding PadR family transcriptional regulator
MRHSHHTHRCGPDGPAEFDPREGWMPAHRRGPRGRAGYGRGGPGYGFAPRGRRARRGAVRAAILVLLGEEPRNGYALIQEIETRSDGTWRPSPGSIYPTLAMMEDEGLIRTVASEDDQRAYELTDKGRTALEERGEQSAPWEAAGEEVGDDVFALVHAMRGVGMAVHQITEAGNAEGVKQAKDILAEARRALYGILAEDPQEDDAG